ncbi:tRNA epoxyqueuosine(34) reductase QueG [Hutsoniella sourekii]
MVCSQELKKLIQDKAHQIGIDKIGFTHAGDFSYMKESLYQQKAMGHTTGFEHPNIEERIYPDLIFDQPQSIIAIALAYPSRIKDPTENKREVKRGQFARASWGIDYHHILRDKLDQLVDYIQELVPNSRFKAMVDTGELMDGVTAQRAGLGFIGRNGLLITKEYGSWVYLGEIITNIKFEPDPPVDYDCGDCYRCINACPTQALLGDGRMNASICLSYQTQTKDYMPESYRKKISNVIYGCDICQLVCPYNQGKDFHNHPQMEPDPEQVQPPLRPLLTMTNREFKEKYGELAGAWRGKKPIQRNAIIALANTRDRGAIPLLLQVMEEDPRPMIRGTAAWSLSQLEKNHNSSLIEAVENQMFKEEDPETLVEFKSAIEKLKSKREKRMKRGDTHG